MKLAALKRVLLRLGILLLIALGGVFVLFFFVVRKVGKLSHGYDQVQREMSVEAVRTLMGPAGTWKDVTSEDIFPAWDDERLPKAEEKRIAGSLRYRAWRPLIGVIFEFTFDADGKLVGRHQYD